MTPPLLLVSNDDGYHSEGIHVLADALESLGEVWVVAPDRENSAVSHALTLSRPLRLTQLAERDFAVDGTPTDCVTLGVGQVLKGRAPDLVVSGINFGANMGDDVHYSGTVSAAFEAVILGVPAIAVSQVVWSEFSYAHAGPLRPPDREPRARARPPARNAAQRQRPAADARGACASPGWASASYDEGVVEDTDPRGRKCYWIGGGDPVWEDIPGTDFAAVGAGYISITPLQLDMTDREQLTCCSRARSPLGPGGLLSERRGPRAPQGADRLPARERHRGRTGPGRDGGRAARDTSCRRRSAIRPTRTTRSRSARGRRSRSPRWWRASRELAAVTPRDRVLEIGAGSGYQAAVLAQLARFVFTVERLPRLAEAARGRSRGARAIGNVSVQVMDGTPRLARPGAVRGDRRERRRAPAIPKALVEQLTDGGRLVIPIGELRRQELVRVVRRGDRFEDSRHGPATFVPLVGRDGF